MGELSLDGSSTIRGALPLLSKQKEDLRVFLPKQNVKSNYVAPLMLWSGECARGY
jgi:hypothetical protein